MPPKEAEPVVRLSVNLPAELHAAIRATAAAEDLTISEAVRAAMTEYVEKKREAQ